MQDILGAYHYEFWDSVILGRIEVSCKAPEAHKNGLWKSREHVAVPRSDHCLSRRGYKLSQHYQETASKMIPPL